MMERLIINHAANLVDHLHNIFNCACQLLKLASVWLKTLYDRVAAVQATVRAMTRGCLGHLHEMNIT
jgi:hypothetical protein